MRKDVALERLKSRAVDVEAEIAVADGEQEIELICLNSMTFHDGVTVDRRFKFGGVRGLRRVETMKSRDEDGGS